VGCKPYQAGWSMSLKLWQIRNDALQADKIMTDYNTQCQKDPLSVTTQAGKAQAKQPSYCPAIVV